MFTAPPLPKSLLLDESGRLAWQLAVLRNAQVAHSGRGLRVACRRDGAAQPGSKSYFVLSPGHQDHYHLATVALNQVVFDLGDIQEGDEKTGNWARCRLEANAVAAGCTSLGIPFAMSLSGGKGVHISIYLPPEGTQSRCHDDVGDDWRWAIAYRILAEAKRISSLDQIFYDKLFIAPREGSYLVWEHGERKTAAAKHRKILWYEGVGPAPDLPEDREEAYRIAEARGQVRPSGIPIAHAATVYDTAWVRQQHGRPCPVGPQCFESEYGQCSDCPAGN